MAREFAETIVEHAFLVLANGVAAELQRQGSWTGSDDQRDTIFSTARIVLYQLLFLLFAEGRGLLPLTHPAYNKQSLHDLIQQIANQAFLPLHKRYVLEDDDPWIWERVRALLVAAQEGRPDWCVPRYGTIISSDHALAGVRIGARQLVQVLDILGRDDNARDAPTPEAACVLRDYRAFDVRLLGEVYERLLGCELEGSSSFTLKATRVGRRASGTFYTPRRLVISLVEETIGPLLEERIAQSETDPTPETRVALLDLALLDPAMGCGTFLLACVDVLAERLLTLHKQASPDLLAALLADMRVNVPGDAQDDLQLLRHLVLQRCIYGVDIDPHAVEIARLSLWLHCCVPGTPLDTLDRQLRCGNSLIGGRLSTLGFLDSLPPNVSAGLALLENRSLGKQGAANDAYQQRIEPIRQALDLSVSRVLNEFKEEAHPAKDEKQARVQAERHRFFHWELAFPTVFFDLAHQAHKPPDAAGFDAIIGNPPYLTTLDAQERAYFMTWSTTRGRELDACYLFVEQALRLLRPGGRCGFVMPSVWMLQSEAEAFRRHVLDHTLISLRDLGFTVFSATVPIATVVIARNSPPAEHMLRLQLRDGSERMVSQTVFRTLTAAQFNARLVETLPLIQHVEAVSAPLNRYAESHEGVHSGNIRHKLFTRVLTPNGKRLLKGADIDRYALQWGGWYVNYDSTLINRSGGEYASLRDERIFTRPKIWTRQTSDRIIATWDEQGFYSDNTLHATQLRPGIKLSPLYLVALLNSRLLTFVYQQHTQEQGRPLAQVKLVFLRQLPIRRIVFTTLEDERARCVEAGMATAADWIKQVVLPPGDATRLLTAFRDSGIDPAEQSDVVHDLLVVLAQKMLDLKQQHTTETTLFLDWLAITIGNRFNDWKGKRVLQAYWLHSWAAIEQMLRQNGFAPTTREDVQTINERWETSCAALVSINTTIKRVDRLIDLLVYWLYDLSDEEITLIESTA